MAAGPRCSTSSSSGREGKEQGAVIKTLVKLGLVTSLAVAGVLAARSAAAEEPDKSAAPPAFRPHFVGDLRALFLIRTDNNYFGHANAYSYPIDPAASGVEL